MGGDTQAFSRSERRIVALSSAAHALVHAEMLVFAVVLVPLSSDLGLSFTQLGFLGTLGYVCFGAGAPFAGWLADRWGPLRVLVGCMLGSAAALVALVLARGAAAVGAAYVLLGIAASLYHPAGLGQLSIQVRALGRALAIHGIAGNIGLAMTPLSAAALTDARGWRAPYAALAVLTALAGIALLGVQRRGTLATVVVPGPARGAGRAPLALLLALAAVIGLVYRGSLTFLPTHFLDALSAHDSRHALSRAGLVTSGALLGGMLGQYLGGRVVGRRRPEGPLVFALSVAVPLLVAITLLRGAALVAATFLFLVAHFANQPLTNALLADYSRSAVRSRVYGLSFALSFGVGALAAGGGGLVAETWGVPAVFLALAALGVLALLLGFALWSRRREAGADGRDLVPAAPRDLAAAAPPEERPHRA